MADSDAQNARGSSLESLDALVELVESTPTTGSQDEQAAHFERLAKLITARNTIALSVRKRSRYPILILLLATVVVFLEVLSVGHTEVEVRLEVSSVRFKTVGNGELVLPAHPKRLSVSGAEHVEVPDVSGGATPYDTNASPLLVTPSNGGRLGVDSVQLNPGTSIDVSLDPTEDLTLRLTGTRAAFQASVLGLLHLASGALDEDRDYQDGDVLVGHASQDLELSVDAPGSTLCVICDTLALSEISFLRDRPDLGAQGGPPPYTVLAGSIHFVEVPVDYEVHRGERVRIVLDHAPSRPSEVRQIRVDPRTGALELTMHAWVRELDVGSATNAVNLMPTQLDSLRARRGPAAAWGALVGMLAVIATVLRWLKDDQ